MNIDLTDLPSREIIKILQNYPSGSLIIKFERVFWASDDSEPVYPRNMPTVPRENGGQYSKRKELTMGDRFGKMSDALGRMVC